MVVNACERCGCAREECECPRQEDVYRAEGGSRRYHYVNLCLEIQNWLYYQKNMVDYVPPS